MGYQWCSSGFKSRAVPCNIFTNDLNAKVECIVSKFADDTKVGGAVDPHEV